MENSAVPQLRNLSFFLIQKGDFDVLKCFLVAFTLSFSYSLVVLRLPLKPLEKLFHGCGI